MPPAPRRLTANVRAFRVMVRNELFRRVQLAARSDWGALGELDASAGFDADAWADAMDTYWDEHDRLGIGAGCARAVDAAHHRDADRVAGAADLRRPGRRPRLRHQRDVDLAESDEAGTAVVRVTGVGMVQGAL